MKKFLNLKNISLIINAIFLTASVVFFVNLHKVNILPIKYFIPLIIIFILLVMIFTLLSLKFSKKKILIIIVDILNLILASILIFGVTKIQETDSFLLKNSDVSKEILNYYVMVNKKSSYKKIKDVKNKEVLYKKDDYSTDIIKELNKKVKTTLKENEDIISITNAVLDDTKTVILISESDYDFIKEINGDYEDNTKILDTITITKNSDYQAKKAKVTQETFNVYISGIDTYGKISTRSRSDVNIIMTINPKDKKILLTSIPRDYYVQLHGTTGLKDKLTHAGVYGINKSVNTIEDLLDTKINYYLRVNFNTLIKVVDELGGIEVDSDKTFVPWTNRACPIKKGKQVLNGKCALAYARERHAYITGDRHRGENQQEVINSIITKATSSSKILTNYSNILSALDGAYQTSMSKDEIYDIVRMQIEDMSKWEVESISLNGSDASEYTHSYPGQKLYVMVPDQKTVTNAKTKIASMK